MAETETQDAVVALPPFFMVNVSKHAVEKKPCEYCTHLRHEPAAEGFAEITTEFKSWISCRSCLEFYLQNNPNRLVQLLVRIAIAASLDSTQP